MYFQEIHTYRKYIIRELSHTKIVIKRFLSFSIKHIGGTCLKNILSGDTHTQKIHQITIKLNIRFFKKDYEHNKTDKKIRKN